MKNIYLRYINKKNLSQVLLALSLMCVGGNMLTSCSDVVFENAVVSAPCSNVAWNNDGRKLTLTWTLPADAIGAIIYKDNVKLVELTEGETSYTIKRAETNVDNLYTIKAVYADGRVSEGSTIKVNVAYDIVTKAGFLLLADTTDDDEVAAREWFKKNYVDKGTGVFVTPADLANINVDEVSRIMILIDREGCGRGWEKLPAEILNAVNALKAYTKDDGKLLLINHATQLVEAIGRTIGFAPNIFGDGAGGNNPDVWGINAIIGNQDGQTYNHSSHALFEGVETGEFTYGHTIIPTIGAGFKEDHNCMWDLNAYGLNGTPNVVVAFENENNASVLGTWQHVVDYCCAAVVEFNPTTEYTGRIIAIGAASYEFAQPEGNAYQNNVEKLAANALEYLK